MTSQQNVRRLLTGESSGTVYASITGLKLKRPWHVLRFYRHAIPSIRQARGRDTR